MKIGIIKRAIEAKDNTEKATADEQIKLEVLGSLDVYGVPNANKLKSALTSIGADVKGTKLPYYVIFNENEYMINSDGKVTKLEKGMTNIFKIQAEVSSLSGDAKTEFYQGFYGKTVNYEPKANIQTSTDEENKSKKAQWKIFYADEQHIYLIADSYVTYDSLPSSETVSFNRVSADNLYRANFNKSELLTEYSQGSARITNKLKELNYSFFHYKSSPTSLETPLTGTGYISMKAVASMLDIEFWDKKYKDNREYAEYSIGGPTVEMILDSYNQTHETHRGAQAYKAEETDRNGTEIAKVDGYKICTDTTLQAAQDRTSTAWGYNLSMFTNLGRDKTYNTLYVNETSSINSYGYWVASPSADSNYNLMLVYCNGNVAYLNYYYNSSIGFRPLVCLKSGVLLKELPEGSNYDFELSC